MESGLRDDLEKELADKPALLTVEQLENLGYISRWSIYNRNKWVDKSKLVIRKVGKKLMVAKADLIDYLVDAIEQPL